MTDEFRTYRQIDARFPYHGAVNHGATEYVRDENYTNTVEGFFSILKRGIYGCYFHVSEAHLKRYWWSLISVTITGSRLALVTWPAWTRRSLVSWASS